MAAGWYVLDRGNRYGPYSEEDLVQISVRREVSEFAQISTDNKTWIVLRRYLEDQEARRNAPQPLRPPQDDGGWQVSPLQGFPTTLTSRILRPFPLVALFLLHYLTLGIYTFFSITATLGGMPKLRTDDPSVGKTIGLCFLPLFNVYWICLIYPRLGQRINGMCSTFQLRPTVPDALTYCVSACMVVPLVMAIIGCVVLTILYLSFPNDRHEEAWQVFFVWPQVFTALNYLIVWPWFSACVQSGINGVFVLQLHALLSQNKATFSRTR
jgi:hypothetical protein